VECARHGHGVRVSRLSLAALEYLVHVDPEDAPTDLVGLAIVVPHGALVETWREAAFPADWRALSAPPAIQAKGDEWVRGTNSLGVWVPSVIIQSEQNFLLNPAHPDMSTVTVVEERPFTFDPRMLYRADPPAAR
jgi:RES domain-containing protein